MTDLTTFPIPTKILDPAEYPEFAGADGTDGTDGRTILNGEVDPTDEGEDGDFYLNTLTSTLFGPKATTWPAGVLLKGSDGVDGATTLAALTDVDVSTLPTDGQALVWDDNEEVWVPGTVATEGGSGTKTLAVFTWAESQPPATEFATLDTRNSIAVLDFDDTVTESTTFVGIIPEGADLSSGILCRIHWAATTATSGDVRWGVQFERAGTDLDADSYDTAALATGTANATSGIETITEITCTTIDSVAAGDRYRLRVYRNSADTANDTMAGDAELIAVELRGVA